MSSRDKGNGNGNVRANRDVGSKRKRPQNDENTTSTPENFISIARRDTYPKAVKKTLHVLPSSVRAGVVAIGDETDQVNGIVNKVRAEDAYHVSGTLREILLALNRLLGNSTWRNMDPEWAVEARVGTQEFMEWIYNHGYTKEAARLISTLGVSTGNDSRKDSGLQDTVECELQEAFEPLLALAHGNIKTRHNIVCVRLNIITQGMSWLAIRKAVDYLKTHGFKRLGIQIWNGGVENFKKEPGCQDPLEVPGIKPLDERRCVQALICLLEHFSRKGMPEDDEAIKSEYGFLGWVNNIIGSAEWKQDEMVKKSQEYVRQEQERRKREYYANIAKQISDRNISNIKELVREEVNKKFDREREKYIDELNKLVGELEERNKELEKKLGEDFRSKLAEEREKRNKELQEKLGEEFQSKLAEEREKRNKELEKRLTEEREKATKRLEKRLTEEREKATKRLEKKLVEEFESKLAEEREKSNKELGGKLGEERERSKKELGRELDERIRAILQGAVPATLDLSI